MEEQAKKTRVKGKRQGGGVTPEEVVEHYANLYYKECLRLCLQARADYGEVCSLIDYTNIERSYELTMNLVGTAPLEKPRAPPLRLFSQPKLFRSFMVQCRKEKAKWSGELTRAGRV
jgi:hypothetical protein